MKCQIQQEQLPGLPSGFNRESFKAALQTANYSQVEGGIFEAFLAGVSQEPFSAGGEHAATWDFPKGLGSGLASKMNLSEVANNETDAKRTLNDFSMGSVFKKAATTFVENESLRIAKDIGFIPQAANKGGSISGSSDTVPALLTPGEFVVKKSAAQSIGYSNLASMNKTGIAKFNKGGAVGVQKFANGGAVSSGDFGLTSAKDVALVNAAAKKNAAAFNAITAELEQMNLDPDAQRAALVKFARNVDSVADEAEI